MSVHDYLYRTSAVPNVERYFSAAKSITYYPSGDQEPFDVDAMAGRVEYLDEQATGGEHKVERLRVRFLTEFLRRNNIHSIQSKAVVRIDDLDWNVLFNECWMGRHYTVLQLVRNALMNRNQMRMTL